MSRKKERKGKYSKLARAQSAHTSHENNAQVKVRNVLYAWSKALEDLRRVYIYCLMKTISKFIEIYQWFKKTHQKTHTRLQFFVTPDTFDSHFVSERWLCEIHKSSIQRNIHWKQEIREENTGEEIVIYLLIIIMTGISFLIASCFN